MRQRSVIWLFAAVPCMFVARHAGANGRYPAASQLVGDPRDPAHLIARTTFGVLDSGDQGGTWQWICENAVGYSGMEDPSIAVSGNGTLVVASSAGLTSSSDRGCSWSHNGGLPDSPYGVDVTAVPAQPREVVALVSSSVNHVYTSRLLRSRDDGASWSTVGAAFGREFVAETVEVPASRGERIYVSGRLVAEDNAPLGGAVARSDDAGQTWTRAAVTGDGTDTLFIGAVDPSNADLIYLRTRSETASRVLVSRDAAETWTEVWRADSPVLGFALSSDGSTVAVGSPGAGVHVASTDGFAFQQVSTVGAQCLTWAGDRLLVCGDERSDGFLLGASTDRGAHFTALLHETALTPRECPESTAAAQTCPALWPGVANALGVDAGGDSSNDSLGSVAVSATPPSTGGCGCYLKARGHRAWPWVLLPSLLALVIVRRKHRRRWARHMLNPDAL